MKSKFAAITGASLMLAACSTVTDLGPRNGFKRHATDVIVIGYLENTGYEIGEHDPEDLLGHGIFYAKLHVSRVESGQLRDRVIPVQYFAHTRLREDISFRFQIRLDEDGKYLVCRAPNSVGYRCE